MSVWTGCRPAWLGGISLFDAAVGVGMACA